jgi:HTH-type transcriptional regulator / antitoxin HigA
MTTTLDREEFAPDWSVHPGEILQERLEVFGISQAELSRRTNLTTKVISEIINGKAPVSADTAVALGPVLGLAPIVWSNLQSEWNLFHARQQHAPSAAKIAEFVDRFPVAELVERGVFAKGLSGLPLLEAVLKLFGVASILAYETRLERLAVHYRHSPKFESSPDHVFTWLQLGELEARNMQLPAFDAAKFEHAVKKQLRPLTVKPAKEFWPQMVALCHAAGVAVVVSHPFSKMRLSGTARWLDTGNAVIQLSLRHKTNDHFWWTFFHECGHVILHPKQNFADDGDGGSGANAEREANEFAEEVLVERDRFAEFVDTMPSTVKQIAAFAGGVGVHPGIVVGMLQHRKVLRWDQLNSLKEKFAIVANI